MTLRNLLFLFILTAIGNQPSLAGSVWTKTKPSINITHIFTGEINRRGKPVGFHAPKAENKKHNKIIKTVSRPNKKGVFSAKVKIWDKQQQRWKQKFSTMFPRRLSNKQIVKAILHAYRNRTTPASKKPWRGSSGFGFPIEGYLSKRGGINTAYPVYIKD